MRHYSTECAIVIRRAELGGLSCGRINPPKLLALLDTSKHDVHEKRLIIHNTGPSFGFHQFRISIRINELHLQDYFRPPRVPYFHYWCCDSLHKFQQLGKAQTQLFFVLDSLFREPRAFLHQDSRYTTPSRTACSEVQRLQVICRHLVVRPRRKFC